jgi:hypothetical protein
VIVLVLLAAPAGANPKPIVWNTPSDNPRGSMPLGNGDITINAWVEPSGDLLFYIGKSDSWEDNGRLAKVGLVRVKVDSPGGRSLVPFEQRLDVASGDMTVTTGEGESTVTTRLWVDANRPVITVQVSSATPTTASASFELWRVTPTALPSIEVGDVNQDKRKPNQQLQPTVVEADTVMPEPQEGTAAEIGWYHHNAKSVGARESMEFQGLLTPEWVDPVLHRTFGAVVRSAGGRRSSDRMIGSGPSRDHRFDVTVLTSHPSTPESWTTEVHALADAAGRVPTADRYSAHLAWWQAFWERSEIEISAKPGTDAASAAEDVTRGYALQRFVTACAGRGAYPIKFNGSTLTVPWPGKPGDADYRKWGPGYFWQNTRLPYAPLITSGDLDLMEPFIKWYAQDMRELGLLRTKRYFGFDDALYYPEVVYFWGAVYAHVYGRETPAAERFDKLQTFGYHKWLFTGGLELSFTLLDYYDHTQDDAFLTQKLLPTVLPVLRFYDKFYSATPTGDDGKLTLYPSQALETLWFASNPTPDVAGLHAVVARLLSLPADRLPANDRSYLRGLQAKLPPIPMTEADGKKMIAPAASFKETHNIETPEVYAIYPFRLVSFEKESAEIGRATMRARKHRGPEGWRQDDIALAYLGMTDEAKDFVVKRARSHDPGCRFPAFWGPNYDWTPDQCHGGVLMKAVQAMLLQTEGDKIFLLPAWPRDWDVRFKLHAPRRTVVTCEVKDGRVTRLEVVPPSRRDDVVIPASFQSE